MYNSPKTEVDSVCERLATEIMSGKQTGRDVAAVKQELQEHEESAKVLEALLQQAEKNAPNDREGNVKVVAVDLQQTLPCPKIRAGVAYYKRKLRVRNFCIYDINKREGTMFLWDEVTGGHGSDEVASCILKWLQTEMDDQGEDFTTLHVICDNCGDRTRTSMFC